MPHPLTISIPTYNRHKQLREMLLRLLPQVNDRWVLHIVDNCSDQPVAEVHADLLAQFGAGKALVFRNPVNIGLAANILRCFEHCDTEWSVILADDDEIMPDAAEAFLDAIAKHPDIVYANFSSTIYTRQADFTTTGLQEFCQRLDNWSNLLFLPCGLYNRNAIIPYMRFGYSYAHTLGPQTALLLQTLKETGGKCFFSSRKVVNYNMAVDVVAWSTLQLNNSVFLLELIPDLASQQAFYEQLYPYYMPLRQLAVRLIERACKMGEDPRALFAFRSVCFTLLRPRLRNRLLSEFPGYKGREVRFFRATLRDRFELPILRFLVAHPHFALKLIKLNRSLHKRNPDAETQSDLLQGL